MKKLIINTNLALILTAAMLTSTLVGATESSCTVLGFHQPNSNIYDGPTWCGDISMTNLIVRGPTELNKTSIAGETEVSGPLIAAAATLNGITMDGQNSPVMVTLKNGTTVNGDIVFQGTVPGKVYLAGGASIHGKVINGIIVNK